MELRLDLIVPEPLKAADLLGDRGVGHAPSPGTSVERVPPEGLALLNMRGRDEERSRHAAALQYFQCAQVVEVAIVESNDRRQTRSRRGDRFGEVADRHSQPEQ